MSDGVLRPAPGARTRMRPAVRAVTAVVLLAAVALGLSALTGNRWLLLVTGACVGLVVQARLWPDGLDRLEVTVPQRLRVAAGDQCSVDVTVRNLAAVPSRPFRLVVEVGGLTPCAVQVGALPPEGSVRTRLEATALKRGAYDGTTVLLASDDPLRLATTVQRRVHSGGAVVRPARRPAAAAVAAGRQRSDGNGPVRPGSGVDLFAVRDWRPGDDGRRVHWRSTARHGRLVVAERGEPDARRLVLATTAAWGTTGTEELVAAAAAGCRLAQLSGCRVDVLAWAAAPPATRPPPAQRAPSDTVDGLLDWWASLTAFTVPAPDRLVSDLPPGTTRLLVLDSPDLPSDWWAQLRRLAAVRGLDLAAVRA